MARISGIDIPKEKRGVVSLTYIYGIGSSRAKMILDSANVSPDKKVSEWSDDDTAKVRSAVSQLVIEGELRAENQINICLLYTSPSPRDRTRSRMPSSA